MQQTDRTDRAGRNNVVQLERRAQPARLTLGQAMAAAAGLLNYPGLCWLIGIWGVLFLGSPDIADGIIHILMR